MQDRTIKPVDGKGLATTMTISGMAGCASLWVLPRVVVWMGGGVRKQDVATRPDAGSVKPPTTATGISFPPKFSQKDAGAVHITIPL